MGVAESQLWRYGVLGLIVPRPIHAYGIIQELRKWPLEDDPKPGVNYAVTKLIDLRLIEDVSSASALAVAAGGESASRTYEAPRRIVQVTSAGREEFERWMTSSLSSEQEILWRIGTAQREHLPVLVRLLREAQDEWYERLSSEPDIGLGNLGTAWSTSTKLALMQVTRRKQLAARGTLFGDLAREMSDLDADTPGGNR